VSWRGGLVEKELRVRRISPVLMRRLSVILLFGALASLLVIPSTISAPAVRSRPVRPDVSTLRLAGVDAAALAELRKQDPAARPAVLTSRRATNAFRLVGVSWVPGVAAPRIDVVVRTRGDRGWSEWRDLEVEGATASPRGALEPEDAVGDVRGGTEPLYVGPSSAVQVRVDLVGGVLPADLRVDLVDPGSSAADAGVGTASVSSAGAAVAQPAIVTRAQWGADESLRAGFAGYGETVKAAFVHHTTGASDYTSAEVPGMIRAIYAYHTQTLGWSDIGYNFIVDRFGRLYEGRWGGMDKPVIGAHTGGFNTDTVGVAALGDHEVDAVPAAVEAAFGQILGWKLGLHGRDPYGRASLVSGGGSSSRYPAGQVVDFDVVSGHRDASYTLCPGQYLYPRLPQLRSEAASYMGRPGPFRAVRPARIVDTRTGLGLPAGVVPAGASRSFQVTGRGGVPAIGVGTVVLNVTAVAPNRAGYLTVHPAGRPRPTTSNLNLSAGRTVPNLVHVATGSGGKVTVYVANADVHVVVDVFGWTGNGGTAFPPGEGLFNPVAPYRALDTRKTTALGPGESRRLLLTGTGGTGGVPAAGVAAVVVNLTVTRPTSPGFLTVYPGGQPLPATSNLNFVAGETRANRVIVPVGSDGTVAIYNRSGSSHVIVDVNGWYTGAGAATGGSEFTGLTPFRFEDTRRSPLGPMIDETRTYQVAGSAGIPAAGTAGAPTAVVLNVTAIHTATTTSGYLTLYPADAATRPTVSDVNFTGSQTVPNLVVVKLAPNGAFSLAAATPDATHAVIDVLGYYTPQQGTSTMGGPGLR
jgi:N-acetylmuramoyl-L-alanine amidase